MMNVCDGLKFKTEKHINVSQTDEHGSIAEKVTMHLHAFFA